MSIDRDGEVLRATHELELLRMVAHGAPDEQRKARAEYDRRIAAEPHAADSYRMLRTVYFVATVHAFGVVQAQAKERYDRVDASAAWFQPFTPGDPLPEA